MLLDADPDNTSLSQLENTADILMLDLGPVVKHNMPCSVHPSLHAVRNMNVGVFEPCWDAQREGWALLKVKPGRGWLFRLLRNWMFDPRTSEGVG